MAYRLLSHDDGDPEGAAVANHWFLEGASKN
jgi:hypothetical protein